MTERRSFRNANGARTRLKRGLRFRLALPHLTIAVLAIVAVGGIVISTGSRRFDSYLQQVQATRNADVIASRAQGGTVSASDAPGGGARFTVLLPAVGATR